jgi:hypothetical protein
VREGRYRIEEIKEEEAPFLYACGEITTVGRKYQKVDNVSCQGLLV